MEANDRKFIPEREEPQTERERFRFLLENSGDILWTVDLTGRWQFITSNVEKAIHIPAKDIVGKMVWDFVTPESAAMLRDKLARRLRGEPIPAYEVMVVDRDRNRIPFEVMTSPIVDEKGAIIGIQGISRDLTERKQAEERIRKSEEKFRDLVENIYDWVWEVDQNAIFTYSSPRIEEYIGYEPGEAIGRLLGEWMTSASWEQLTMLLGHLVSHPGSYATSEAQLICRKGDVVDMEMTVGPVFADDGTLKGYRGICRNISDRKRAEEALHKAYGELEKRVEERTKELAQARDQAELYLDLMSHDINNMSTMAMGYIEMSSEAVGDVEPSRKMLSQSLQVLANITRLIANVRKLQQAEAGYLPAETVDVCEVLDRVRKNFIGGLGRSITIDTRIEGPCCKVLAGKLIDDVFTNLIDNAIKHSRPDQPVTIEIALAKAFEDGKAYTMVTLADHGPGIPDDQKCKLFTRLQRGTTKATGRGLGLYLVKTLVEDYGGKVRVEDRVKGDPSQGAKFVVLLPSAREEPDAGTGTCMG